MFPALINHCHLHRIYDRVENILNYLINISNANLLLNLLNHFIIYFALILFFVLRFIGKIKAARIVRNVSVILLILSIIGNALYYGNPFHLITFSVTLIFFIIFQKKALKENENFATNKQNDIKDIAIIIISAIFIFLGVFYPEFVEVSIPQYLLFAPVGIVPCPTLLVILGFFNLTLTKSDKKTEIAFIILTCVYAIIGTFIFKVYLDITLILLAIFSIINLFMHSERKN